MLIKSHTIKKGIIALATTTLVGGVSLSVMPKETAIVKAAQATITVSDATVNKGDAFDLTAGVTGKDSTGADATAQIKVVGSVDTNAVGSYKLTYSLVDSTGERVEVERTITVVEPVVKAVGVLNVHVGYIGIDQVSTYIPGVVVVYYDQKTGSEVARVTSTGKVDSVTLPYGTYTYLVVSPAGLTHLAGIDTVNITKDTQDETVGLRDSKTAFYIQSYMVTDDAFVPVIGTRFEIKDLSGNIVYVGEASKDGDVYTELPDGEYTIRLVEVPKGYKLSETTARVQKARGYGQRNNVYPFEFEKIAEVPVSQTDSKVQPTPTQTSTPTSEQLPDTGGASHLRNGIVGSTGLLVLVIAMKRFFAK